MTEPRISLTSFGANLFAFVIHILFIKYIS